jgi:hypothetical protein
MVRGPCKKKRWIADLIATYGLDVIDWPGMPGRSYELLFALSLLDGRINTRRSFVILDGVKGALSPTIEPRFFSALFERDDDAEFYSALHADRVRFFRERSKRAGAEAQFFGEAGA